MSFFKKTSLRNCSRRDNYWPAVFNKNTFKRITGGAADISAKRGLVDTAGLNCEETAAPRSPSSCSSSTAAAQQQQQQSTKVSDRAGEKYTVVSRGVRGHLVHRDVADLSPHPLQRGVAAVGGAEPLGAGGGGRLQRGASTAAAGPRDAATGRRHESSVHPGRTDRRHQTHHCAAEGRGDW